MRVLERGLGSRIQKPGFAGNLKNAGVDQGGIDPAFSLHIIKTIQQLQFERKVLGRNRNLNGFGRIANQRDSSVQGQKSQRLEFVLIVLEDDR